MISAGYWGEDGWAMNAEEGWSGDLVPAID